MSKHHTRSKANSQKGPHIYANLLDGFSFPSSIREDTFLSLLQNIVKISKDCIFNELDSKCFIGFVAGGEEACLKFNPTIADSSHAAKFITEKQLPANSYAKKSGCDFQVDLKTFADVKEAVLEKDEDALAIVRLKNTTSPFKYNIVTEGPIDTKNKTDARSSDILSFGPMFTSLHVDVDHGNRTSVIPSWNIGTMKFWFIRKNADVRTQKLVNPAMATTPQEQVEMILNHHKDYALLVQEPGDVIRHRGKHYHCVITAINKFVNPSELCSSIGRIDTPVEEKIKYVRQVPLSVVSLNRKKKITRKAFMNNQLTKAVAKTLKPKCKRIAVTRGFPKGNDAWRKRCATELRNVSTKEEASAGDNDEK